MNPIGQFASEFRSGKKRLSSTYYKNPNDPINSNSSLSLSFRVERRASDRSV